MDVSGGSTANSAAVQSYACNGTASQTWTLLPITTSVGSGYQVIAAVSGSCLEIAADSTGTGGQTEQAQCLGAGKLSQVWAVYVFSSGYELVSLVSGKCLNLPNGDLRNGVQLQQVPCAQGHDSKQLWKMNKVSSTFPTASTLMVPSGVLVAGQAISLTGTVSTGSITPAGAVRFYQNGTFWTAVSLNALGRAAVSTSGLPAGISNVTMVYAGNGIFAGSTANLAVTVTQATAGVQALQADALVDSIGVQMHIGYTDTPYYSQWKQLLPKLTGSGIRHVRDTYTAQADLTVRHQQLAAAGIHEISGMQYNMSTADTIAMKAFIATVGNVEAVESPNECDTGSNCGGGSLTGMNNVAAYMPFVRSQADSISLPVVGPSFTNANSYGWIGSLKPYMAYNNLHVYFGGHNPGTEGWGGGDAQGHRYGSIPFWMDAAQNDGAQIPVILTESGYVSFPTATQPGSIPESVQALYEPRLLMLAFQQGVIRTYLYELVDEPGEPGYGLLHTDITEKPAFTAVKSLISLLKDPGAPFTPGHLSYTISGADSSLRTLLLQKRDGTFWLAAWLENSAYDADSNTTTPVAPQRVSLAVPTNSLITEVVQFDNTGSTSSRTNASSSLGISLSDAVTLFRIQH